MTILTIAEVNALDRAGFAAAFGGVYECSPWVAETAAAARPFAGVDDLLAAMSAGVRAAGADAQTALVRAHPDLAGRAAVAGEMTPESRAEQAAAGLDQCTAAEFARFQELNAAYKAKFGFPFVMAVRGAGRADILIAFAARLENDRAQELDRALQEIDRIARLRLADLVRDDKDSS